MFAWGEDAARGFWIKSSSDLQTQPGIQHLKLDYRLTDLSAAHGPLVFVKSNGNSFVIPGSRDGRRAGGKQKFVKGREKIQAACCRDDDDGGGGDDVTLLSEKGNVLCVNTRRDNIPRPLQALCNIAVAQVACGNQHSMALTKGGQVFTWGQDSRGQLGLGGRMKSGVGSPQLLGCLSAVPLVQVSAGGDQSFAVSVSGGVLGWGRNDRGQLGLGDTADRRAPTPVHCLNMKKSVHVSCGTDHTVVLTKNGGVFTFGSGQYGQLGHNSFKDELRPRLVAELLGAKVTKTACGRHHTLVLTDSNRVYSFGRGDQGQLGRDENHPSVPLPVQLTHDATDAPQIRSIFAGGNRSYATCTSNEEVAEDENKDNGRAQHRLDDMIDRWSSECDSKTWEKTRKEIRRMFSSASCLNASFLEQSNDKHFQTSPKYSGLDFPLARLAFKKLLKNPDAFAEVEAAVLQLLPGLDKKPLGVEQLRVYLLLNELLHAIQQRGKSKRGKRSIKLAVAGAAAILSLSADSRHIIGDWWSLLPPSTKQIHLKVWTQVLSVVVFLVPVPRIPGVRNLLVLLQYMYDTNSRTAEPQRMPESSFHLTMDQEFLIEELRLWYLRLLDKNANAEPLILFNYPTVMDLASKKFVFDQIAEYAKTAGMDMDIWGFEFTDCVTFQLWLSRASVLEDTFEHLTAAERSDYRFRLQVFFNDNLQTDMLNLKDFFYEVFHEMVSAEYGMFMFNDSKTLAWFPSKAAEEDQRYFQFGVLCGLALYNQHIVHLPFPLALFKKLLGVKPSLEDMLEFSPCVGESLLNILKNYNDEDIENLFMDFAISWDETVVDLDPGNPEKPVTGENKKEFVDAYVNHAFNTSVERVFKDFERGFFQVCERNFVKLFRPKELQEVMVGNDFQDWEKLKQNAVYEGVYKTEPQHPIIQTFWEVFDELTEDQKKAFLWFVTGFDRVPIVGLDNFKIKVAPLYVKDGSHDQFYPQSHTCYPMLELPLYSTKEIMQAKLTEVLSNKKKNYMCW